MAAQRQLFKGEKKLAAARHGLVVMERSKVIMVVGGCVAGLALVLWIGQTERGREWRDPVGFWKEKVDSEKMNVDRYKGEVRRCARDIGLITSAEGKRSFEIQHKLNGGDEAKVGEAYKKDLAVRVAVCDMIVKMLDITEQRLAGGEEKLRTARMMK